MQNTFVEKITFFFAAFDDIDRNYCKDMIVANVCSQFNV